MGNVSKVLNSDGVDVKSDRGSGDNVTAHHFSAPGDDSHPLPDDYAALTPSTGTGRQLSVAYRDGKNAAVAGPGEKRIYSRDAEGNVKASAYLKSDGTIELKNVGNASIIGMPDGSVVINGVTIPVDGSDIILANGRSLMHHGHPQGPDGAGNTEQNTGDTLP